MGTTGQLVPAMPTPDAPPDNLVFLMFSGLVALFLDTAPTSLLLMFQSGPLLFYLSVLLSFSPTSPPCLLLQENPTPPFRTGRIRLAIPHLISTQAIWHLFLCKSLALSSMSASSFSSPLLYSSESFPFPSEEEESGGPSLTPSSFPCTY